MKTEVRMADLGVDANIPSKQIFNEYGTHPALVLCPSCVPEKVGVNKEGVKQNYISLQGCGAPVASATGPFNKLKKI
jgi:hypothetical protein